MINMLLGAPGGGKSYEAVCFHVLPALQKGRKVITNLPLNLDAFADLDPSYVPLIELRHESKAGKGVRPFSQLSDYSDPWRHPESGAGPLYVIDECHKAVPRMTAAADVLEWFAEHRHETADVLLVTQSYGKLHRDLQDMVQFVYRVRKALALGFDGKYIRKVQDGIRGQVMNESIRTYQKKYFPLYKSHTRGGGAEESAQDVKPIWQHWSFIGAGLCVLTLLAMPFFLDFSNPLNANTYAKPAQKTEPKVVPSRTDFAQVQPSEPVPVAIDPPALVLGHVPPLKTVSENPPITEIPKQAEPSKPPEPYGKHGLHLLGSMRFPGKPEQVYFALSQGGQGVMMLTLNDVLAVGYGWQQFGACSGVVVWHGEERHVVCDAPRLSVNIPLI